MNEKEILEYKDLDEEAFQKLICCNKTAFKKQSEICEHYKKLCKLAAKGNKMAKDESIRLENIIWNTATCLIIKSVYRLENITDIKIQFEKIMEYVKQDKIALEKFPMLERVEIFTGYVFKYQHLKVKEGLA